jgi:hypothetical protein
VKEEDLGRWRGDEAALALIEQASLREGLAVPHIATWDGESVDFIALLELRASQRLRARELEHEGDVLGAAEALWTVMRIGALLKDGDTDLLGWANGMAWMQPEDLRELALRHADDDALHAWLHERLATLPIERSAARALTLECRLTESLLSDKKAFDGINTSPLLYDLDATLAWHRATCRSELAVIALPLDERSRPPQLSLLDGPERFIHNPAGRQLLSMAGMDRFAMAEREDRLVATLHGFKALVALRVGMEPSLDDGLGGTLVVSDTEVWSTRDGSVLQGETVSLRWPRHTPSAQNP